MDLHLLEVLEGKKILFISPKFFGYEKDIKNKLEDYGANLYWIDDRPSNSFFIKATIRLGLSKYFINNHIIKYFNSQLKKIENVEFDYIFVVNPEAFSEKIIEIYKKHFKNAQCILYMWDSINNKKNTPNSLSLFDKRYSFDKNDSLTYNMEFRPLFFGDSFKKNEKKNDIWDEKYFFCFIGTAHSDRYFLVKKILKQLTFDKNNYVFFFLPNKILFFYHKIFNSNFKKVKVSDISFLPLSKKRVSQIIKESSIVLDIHHPHQEGLTMRTIEVLGCQKKLITTNTNISEYDFFDRHNILIIDRYNPIIPDTFLTTSFKSTQSYLYEKYSIDGWLKDIFCY